MKTIFFTLVTCVCLMLQCHNKALGAANTYYCQPCNGNCDEAAYTTPGKCPHCGMDLIEQTAEQHKQAMAKQNYTIAFYLQPGVEVLDFAGPMEVFANAGFKVFTVSKTKDPIVSQGILKIIPDYSIADAPPAKILAFFGGNSSNPSNDAEVINWVKNYPKPDYYFSVCTGAFVLAKAGLLDNMTATTFHLSIDDLKKAAPKAKVLSNVRFVDNGKLITTAGISAGIDGALHLVAKIRGEEGALKTAEYMEYDKWVPKQGLILDK